LDDWNGEEPQVFFVIQTCRLSWSEKIPDSCQNNDVLRNRVLAVKNQHKNKVSVHRWECCVGCVERLDGIRLEITTLYDNWGSTYSINIVILQEVYEDLEEL